MYERQWEEDLRHRYLPANCSTKKLVFADSFADSEGKIIPPPKEMAGQWAQELIITVELQEQNSDTHITLTHEGIPVGQSQDCITSWQQSLNKMEEHLKHQHP